MVNASAIFEPQAIAGALDLVNHARTELLLPDAESLPSPRWINTRRPVKAAPSLSRDVD
jgi:hypothetical protein